MTWERWAPGHYEGDDGYWIMRDSSGTWRAMRPGKVHCAGKFCTLQEAKAWADRDRKVMVELSWVNPEAWIAALEMPA